jgi:ribosome-associated heat shock protein Hsp15
MVKGRREEDSDSSDTEVRLDKWLWAARFFKTRALAQQAIEGGKVYIDDVRGKPSRIVQIGHNIVINSPRGRFEIVVVKVTPYRGSPTVAAELYQETAESKEQRERVEEMRRLASFSGPSERPSAHDRKLLRRIKEG